MFQLLSQHDPRWAGHKIGPSASSVGGFGCTLTCVAMTTDEFGFALSPLELSSVKGYFDRLGRILWNALRVPHLMFSWRDYVPTDQRIAAHVVSGKTAAILQVWGGRHWIKAIGMVKTKRGTDWLCANPATGRTCLARATYGRLITGAAYFIKT